MTYRFRKHYTLEAARALLPQVRTWLQRLLQLRKSLEENDARLGQLAGPGCDLGGEAVNAWVKTLADIQTLGLEFQRREIQLKDLDRGLIDFPSLLDGKEIFLCWEEGEEDIEFWHDLDAGYAGRERL